MIKYHKLNEFVTEIFLKIGFNLEDSELAAKVLVSADARGIESHGIARIPGYIRLFENDRLNPKAKISIIHQTPSTAVVDADKGLGLVIAPKSMEIAMEKAENVGTGWISVQNSNHFGIAGYHAMLPLKKKMIGWAMTNAGPLVTPTFSKERLLGTNPIAIAIPAEKQPAFVADFATTSVAYGKLEILQRLNKDCPEGWVQDKDGNPSFDSNAIKNGGALLPLGGDRLHGSHKGYALGSIVDILSGVLSGANFGPWVPPFATAGFMNVGNQVGKGTGHFLGAMRVDAFRPESEFLSDMDIWIERFRSAPSIEGEKVLIPGDPERILEEDRILNGIPVSEELINLMVPIIQKYHLENPF